MQKEEQKVGLSTMNWVLSILGIMFFSSFIILPPIFRLVFKEEEILPPIVEQVERSFSCSREEEGEEGVNSYQYSVQGVNDSLNVVAYTEKNSQILSFGEGISECDTLNSIYSNSQGMYYLCQEADQNKQVDVRITVSIYQGSVPTFILSYQNETFTTYRDKLIQSGFACSEIQ